MKGGLIISAWWAATPDRNVTRQTKTKDLRCWEADQPVPSVPSEKAYFSGCTVPAPWGEKIKFKDTVVSQTGIKWWNIHKTSSFIRVLSLSLVDEMEPPHILFCLQWKGKRWKEKQKARTERKRRCFQRRQMYFQSLSWSQIKIPLSFMKHVAPWAFICTSVFCL